MAFPSSPSNAQQATVNGITYVYNSSKTAWLRASTTGANLTANSLTITSTATSISSTSGALIVAGGAGVAGNLYVGGTLFGNGFVGPVSASIATILSGSPGQIILGNDANGAIEIGQQGRVSSGSPFLDFHSAAGSIDYDVRLQATGGSSGTAGLGNLTITSTGVQLNSLGVGTSSFGNVGEIRATNNIVSYFSDERLKTKLGVIENALDKVDQLSGFYYEANNIAQDLGFARQREVGVSAQVTQSVLPEIVKPAPIDEQYLTVQYERFAPLLIEAIKELRQEVNAIKQHLGL